MFKIEAFTAQRQRAGYGELQSLLGHIGRMRDLLFPSGQPPPPGTPLALTPAAVAGLSRAVSDAYRCLSALSQVFTNSRDPVVAAAVAAAAAIIGASRAACQKTRLVSMHPFLHTAVYNWSGIYCMLHP